MVAARAVPILHLIFYAFSPLTTHQRSSYSRMPAATELGPARSRGIDDVLHVLDSEVRPLDENNHHCAHAANHVGTHECGTR